MVNNKKTAYDWFLWRHDIDDIKAPTMEHARKVANWINSHDCKPVTAQTVFDWLYEEYLDYIASTQTWNK